MRFARSLILLFLLAALLSAIGARAQNRESELDFNLLKGFTNFQASREIRASLTEYWATRERLGARERELGGSVDSFRQDDRWNELDSQRRRAASRFYTWVPADFFERDGQLKFVDDKGHWKEPLSRSVFGKPMPSRLEASLEREWLKLEAEYAGVFKRQGAQVHYVISPTQASVRGIFVLLGDAPLLLVRSKHSWKRYLIGSRAIPLPSQGLKLDSFGNTRILVHPKKGVSIWKEN